MYMWYEGCERKCECHLGRVKQTMKIQEIPKEIQGIGSN